jgi:hypothetical protein
VTALKVSATLLEQSSSACQLHFNKAFLKTLIARLQSADQLAAAGLSAAAAELGAAVA